MIASTLLTRRLRSSAMCSWRVIRPSSSFGRPPFARSRPIFIATGGRAGRSAVLRRRRAVAVHVRLRLRLLDGLLGLLLGARGAGVLGQLALLAGADLLLPDLLRLAELPHELGQLRGAEEQDHDDEDDDPLGALRHAEEWVHVGSRFLDRATRSILRPAAGVPAMVSGGGGC